MKLTIIPSDGAVYENGLCYSGLTWSGTPSNVHALQWKTDSGWIEFNDGSPNETITVLPAWATNAQEAWTEANTPKPPIPPDPPEPPTAEQNKQIAIGLLAATDFVELPSVSDPDPSHSPYLMNKADFMVYRNDVRIYAVYPVAGHVDWPIKPVEQWSDPFANLP